MTVRVETTQGQELLPCQQPDAIVSFDFKDIPFIDVYYMSLT